MITCALRAEAVILKPCISHGQQIVCVCGSSSSGSTVVLGHRRALKSCLSEGTVLCSFCYYSVVNTLKKIQNFINSFRALCNIFGSPLPPTLPPRSTLLPPSTLVLFFSFKKILFCNRCHGHLALSVFLFLHLPSLSLGCRNCVVNVLGTGTTGISGSLYFGPLWLL